MDYSAFERRETASFSDVVVSVDSLFLLMDTSTQSLGARESGIDNIAFTTVPEPTLLTLCAAIALALIIKPR